MSEKTNIEWATSTGNPWLGCTKVSPGCKNCYAAELDEQKFSKTMGGGTKEKPISHWGKGAPRVRTKGFWKQALKWNREAGETHQVLSRFASQIPGEVKIDRPRIFPSLCDWLDDEVPIEWLADFLKLIHDTPNLDWLLLTKRPENFDSRIYAAYVCESWHGSSWPDGWRKGISTLVPDNVWIGVSVEDQKRADERILLLLQIPAKVRFLSVEPLLSPVDLSQSAVGTCKCSNCGTILKYPKVGLPVCPTCGNGGRGGQRGYRLLDGISWCIVGGESGRNRRDCGVEAICDVARQCVAAGVPVFTKQDVGQRPGQQGRIPADVWALKQFPKL